MSRIFMSGNSENKFQKEHSIKKWKAFQLLSLQGASQGDIRWKHDGWKAYS